MKDKEKYAVLSKAAYDMYGKDTPRAERVKKTQDNINKKLDGFVVDPESNSKRSVFVNHDKKEVVIAHRGTVPTNKSDLTTDAGLAANVTLSTNRYKTAIEKDKETKKKWKAKGYSVSITGHSLGGSISYESAKQNKMKAHTYNAGSGVDLGTMVGGVAGAIALPSAERLRKAVGGSTKKEKKADKNIVNHRTTLDPVSITHRKRHGQHKTTKQKHLDPHTIDNFIKKEKKALFA